MKNFKKILAVVLALALTAVIFAACSGGKNANSQASDETESAAAADAAAISTVTDGKLTMATNAAFPPYEYVEGDQVIGIDAEIAAKIAEKLGLELEIVDTEFDSIIPGVQSGKFDMGMAGMTVTDERLESVNFSDSYAKGVQVIIVPEGSAITSVDDINENTKIGCQVATTGSIYAQDDYGVDAVQEYSKGADAVQALLSGKVDCVIIDNEPAKAFVAENEGLVILDTAYVEEDYAICFNKNAGALEEQVNEALKELIADGTVQSILDKYISAE
ncbi:MAG: amino acid ABC transporter substrate-binding protein [Eubacterium sp.]|nr:amino acid ABC transporter substrate-binding protein [Eubacterium sp.]